MYIWIQIIPKMKYEDNQFIVPESLYWKGVLHNFSKSRTALQPIFEAFTNAIEAIKIKQQTQLIKEKFQ